MNSENGATRAPSPYPPRYHRENDEEHLISFMRQTAMGSLVTFEGDRFQTTALPFLVKQDGGNITLLGHFPRVNPQAQLNASSALVIFQGPQAYVRPDWYPTKRKDPRTAPTWDYIAVRAEAQIEIIDDLQYVLEHVKELSDHFESGKEKPWSINDAPAAFNTRQAGMLVGLKLHVQHLSGVWKIHQNHPQKNRLAVIEGLRETGDYGALGIADAMEQRETLLAKAR